MKVLDLTNPSMTAVRTDAVGNLHVAVIILDGKFLATLLSKIAEHANLACNQQISLHVNSWNSST